MVKNLVMGKVSNWQKGKRANDIKKIFLSKSLITSVHAILTET
jgi:hypothetical protein